MARLGAAVFGVLGALFFGCGGPGHRANVSPSSMPADGTFTGVWNSPQYGEMHLVQTGNSVVGCYVRDERRGQIQGRVQGNLMRFEWSERREMVVGHPRINRGHGYFQYVVDENGDHVFTGAWGVDDDEVGGGPWNAWKDRRRTRRPDPECGGTTTGNEEPQGDTFEDNAGSGSTPAGTSGGGRDDGLEGVDL